MGLEEPVPVEVEVGANGDSVGGRRGAFGSRGGLWKAGSVSDGDNKRSCVGMEAVSSAGRRAASDGAVTSSAAAPEGDTESRFGFTGRGSEGRIGEGRVGSGATRFGSSFESVLRVFQCEDDSAYFSSIQQNAFKVMNTPPQFFNFIHVSPVLAERVRIKVNHVM